MSLEAFAPKPELAREIAPDLAAERRALGVFAQLSHAPFDIVCLPEGRSARALTEPAHYLDEGSLFDRHRAAERLLGALDASHAGHTSQVIAAKIARRIARRAAPRLGLPAETIEKAWYFSLWTELCVLVPARRLARLLAKDMAEKASGALIVIPLAKCDFTYLGFWAKNELEPFYLAVALRRAGARVLLALENETPEAAALTADVWEGRRGALHFHPDVNWTADGIGQPLENVSLPSGIGRGALAPSGLRGVGAILEHSPGAIVFSTRFSYLQMPDAIDPWRGAARPPILALPLRRNWACTASARVFSPDGELAPLEDLLLSALGQTTVEVKAAADRAVARLNLTEAHVSDHLFFEPALIAQAVRERGGAVTLWPHSSNPVHAHMYGQGEVAEIRCAVQSSADIWAKRLPNTRRVVDAHGLLQPCAAPRPLQPGPLHIVVFGGAYALQRWPLLPRRRHEEAYVKLFRGLARLQPRARVFYKAKDPWESADWMRSLLDGEACFEETLAPPTALDFPNMIFLSVCFGSAALLEGLGRGIPCMIAREYPLEDYTCFDEGSIPIGDVDNVLQALTYCSEPAFLDALTRQELAWYATQTRFGA